MVVTDKFVYIHKPKTGGTFVTDALLRLYDGKWNMLQHAKLAMLKEIHFTNQFGKLSITANKHGGCLEIPAKYSGKRILSTIRNPFDYYVSQYEFGWWKRKEWLKYYQGFDYIKKQTFNFPDLSFIEFMELMPAVFNEAPHTEFHNEKALGRYTVEFIQSHFREPKKVLEKLSDEYVESSSYKKDMFSIYFIFTHKLNEQLHQYLLQQEYQPEAIEFILNKEKVLPQGKGRTKEQKWQKYYSPELHDLVRKKDWFLFKLFPEFDTA